jgi:Protein of unknown function (DUF742)
MSSDRSERNDESRGALIRPFIADLGNLAGRAGQADSAAVPGAGPLRPYLLTSGRVAGDDSLEIEAVVTTELGWAALERLSFEHRDIVALCVQPMSVAEVAAPLRLHIGVVRVLVGDLWAAGYLTVLRPPAGLFRDAETIKKVIRGLEAIS